MLKFSIRVLLLSVLVAFYSCDEKIDPIPPDTKKTSGFVVVGATSNGSAVVKYIEELPGDGGSVDLSTGVTDFPRFFPNGLFDHALFLPNPNESVGGFAKYVVDQNGILKEEGTLPTVASSSFRIGVKDANTGVYHDRSTPKRLTVFNPTTMQVTGTIDMSAAFVPGGVDQRYQSFFFRGNDVFSHVREESGGDFPSFIVHQANLSNNTFVGDTQREGDGLNGITTFNQFGQGVTDSQGNLYILDGGNFDGAGIPASLNKIPASSNKFDASYQFFPARVLNPANIFLPTANTFYVTQGTRGIAVVNAETPQAAIDIVMSAGGVQNLTPEQIQQVLGILFTAESAKWCELDLVAKTVTPISGVPNLGAFSAATVFRHNGEFYLPVPTRAETAYYRFNPTTRSAQKAFSISGADLIGVYNLAENN